MGDGGAGAAGAGGAGAAGAAGEAVIFLDSFRKSLFIARQRYIDRLNEQLQYYKAEYSAALDAGEKARIDAMENAIGIREGIIKMSHKNAELIVPPGSSDQVEEAKLIGFLTSGNMLKEAEAALTQIEELRATTSVIITDWRIKLAVKEYSIIKSLTEQTRGMFGAQGGRRRIKKSKKRRRSHKTKKSA